MRQCVFQGSIAVLTFGSAVLWCPAHSLAGNGDYDGDGDVDTDDFAYWASCMAGPAGDAVHDEFSPCSAFDFDEDLDVDAQDLGAFQAAFNKPPSADCDFAGGGLFARYYAGVKQGSLDSDLGIKAVITPPHHAMKLCEESTSIEGAATRIFIGVSEKNDIHPLATTHWQAQFGYARRRFKTPPIPYVDGVILEGFNSEIIIRTPAFRIDKVFTADYNMGYPFNPPSVPPNQQHPNASSLSDLRSTSPTRRTVAAYAEPLN